MLLFTKLLLVAVMVNLCAREQFSSASMVEKAVNAYKNLSSRTRLVEHPQTKWSQKLSDYALDRTLRRTFDRTLHVFIAKHRPDDKKCVVTLRFLTDIEGWQQPYFGRNMRVVGNPYTERNMPVVGNSYTESKMRVVGRLLEIRHENIIAFYTQFESLDPDGIRTLGVTVEEYFETVSYPQVFAEQKYGNRPLVIYETILANILVKATILPNAQKHFIRQILSGVGELTRRGFPNPDLRADCVVITYARGVSEEELRARHTESDAYKLTRAVITDKGIDELNDPLNVDDWRRVSVEGPLADRLSRMFVHIVHNPSLEIFMGPVANGFKYVEDDDERKAWLLFADFIKAIRSDQPKTFGEIMDHEWLAETNTV